MYVIYYFLNGNFSHNFGYNQKTVTIFSRAVYEGVEHFEILEFCVAYISDIFFFITDVNSF